MSLPALAEKTVTAALLVLVGSISIACRSTAPAGAPSSAAAAGPTWEAKEYRNDELRFIVRYPARLEPQTLQPGVLFSAALPMSATRDAASLPAGLPELVVLTRPAAADESVDTVAAGVEATLGAISGGEARATAKRNATLKDGTTSAMEVVVEWQFMGTPLQSLVLAARRNDTLIMVTATGSQSADRAVLSEIVYTLRFAP